jgi:hypothetical protein
MMVLLVTIILFLITLIWAQLKDRKDVIDVRMLSTMSTLLFFLAKAALDEGQSW